MSNATFVDSATFVADGVSSGTVTIPSTVVFGDLMVLAVSSTASHPPVLSGLVSGSVQVLSATHLIVFLLRAGESYGGGAVDLTWPGTTDVAVILMVARHAGDTPASLADVIDASASKVGSGLDPSCDDLAADVDGNMAIYFMQATSATAAVNHVAIAVGDVHADNTQFAALAGYSVGDQMSGSSGALTGSCDLSSAWITFLLFLKSSGPLAGAVSGGDAITGLATGGVTPANDNFIDAAVITGASGSTTGSNLGANPEINEPDNSYQPATNSVWWKWVAAYDGPATFDTIGSSNDSGPLDTVMDIWTGSDITSLALVGSDDDGGGSGASSFAWDASGGTTYYVRVYGYGPTDEGDIALNWTNLLDTNVGALVGGADLVGGGYARQAGALVAGAALAGGGYARVELAAGATLVGVGSLVYAGQGVLTGGGRVVALGGGPALGFIPG